MAKLLSGFNKAELTLLGCAALFSCAITHLILSDFSLIDSDFAAKGVPIAAVEHPTNKVKRRPAGLPVWNDVVSTEQVYQYDQIYTDKNSGVRIRFNSDDEIEISENALVVIERFDDMASIDIKRGIVLAHAKSDAPRFRITGGGSTTIFTNQGSQAAIEVNDGSARVSMMEGEAEIQSNGKNFTLLKDSEVTVSGRTASVDEPPIRILTQGQQAQVYVSHGDRKVKWSRSNKATSYRFEVAKDVAFKNVVHRLETIQNEALLPSDLKGKYFLRVAAVDAEDVRYSVEKQVRIEPLITPNLTWPPAGKTFQQTDDTFATFLNWEEDSAEQSYDVELASSPNFSVPLLKKSVAAPPLLTPELGIGMYYVRVRAVRRSGLATPWSSIREFRVAPKQDYEAEVEGHAQAATVVASAASNEVPVQSIKDDAAKNRDATLRTRPLASIPPVHDNRPRLPHQGLSVPRLLPAPSLHWDIEAAREPRNRNRIVIQWKPVNKAKRYEVAVAKDEGFEQMVVQRKLTAHVFSDQLSSGQYYSRVRSIGDDGRAGQWSKPVQVAVIAPNLLKQPVLTEPDASTVFAYRKHLPRVKFAWNGQKEAKAYDIQVARDQLFSDLVLDSSIASNATTFPLRHGTYYWRVRAKNPDELSKWAAVRSFSVEQNQSVPELTFPKSGLIVDFDETERRTLDVTWEGADDLDDLVVVVARDPSFSNLLGRVNVSGNSTKILVKEDGKYYWQLRGTDKQEKVAIRSNYASFSVTTTEINRPPRVEERFRIEALHTPSRLDYSSKVNDQNVAFDVIFSRTYQLALRGWLNDDWGFEADFNKKWAKKDIGAESGGDVSHSTSFNITELGGAFKRRWTVGAQSYPIDLALRFGYFYHPIFTFYTDNVTNTYGIMSHDTHNVLLGFETRIPLGGAFNIESKFDYLHLLTSGSATFSDTQQYFASTTLVGQFFRYISMSLGGFYRHQSYTYKDPANSADGSLDATYIGILYGLGYIF